jgi:hypothetical protein
MNEKAIIADDGRLLCANPTCKNVELHYHIQHDRYDAYRIRYNAKTHEAYLVEDPMDGETLEVYDEYLHCPHCMTLHKMPLDENEQYPGIENISHEGDFHRARKPETPPGECPICGSTEVKLVEDVQISRPVRESEDHVIHAYDNHGTEWDTATNTRLWCQKCYCEWSVPHDFDIED